MSQSMRLNSQNNYEIKVFGQPDNSRLDLFGEAKTRIEIQEDDIKVTTISNIVMDQAGLVGLICPLHGLEIMLISMRLIAMLGRKTN